MSVRTRASIGARVTWSVLGVLAAVGLLMTITTNLLMAYVPESVVAGVPAASPDGGAFPSGSVPAPITDPADTARLLVFSAVAFVVVVAVGAAIVRSVVIRALAPLQRIDAAARAAADVELGSRVAVAGAPTEVASLAATFNSMLDRLEQAFEARRRFTANASHELQTPLATTQVLLDLALDDEQHAESHELLRQLRDVNARSIGTVRALLELADVSRADRETGAVRLDAAVIAALEEHRCRAVEKRVTMQVELTSVEIDANPELTALALRNLVDNALRHNRPGGCVLVRLGRSGQAAVLEIENSGAQLSPDQLRSVTEPFYRAAGRVGGGDMPGGGWGIGAALVAEIARSHGWELVLAPGSAGGLRVQVLMPVRGLDVEGSARFECRSGRGA